MRLLVLVRSAKIKSKSMRRLFLSFVVASCFLAPLLGCDAAEDPEFVAKKERAMIALLYEEQIRRVFWSPEYLLYAGVRDDGSSWYGYAMFICDVVRRHGITEWVRVRVVDINTMRGYEISDWRVIDDVKCWTLYDD